MSEPDLYDKKNYKYGMFYHHKNNEKLWVPKGDGLGWTLNFANRWSYVVLALFIALSAGIVVFALTRKG